MSQQTPALPPDEVTLAPTSAPGASTAVPVGERYLLHEEIARGGMGAIFRATDTVLKREVAVKVLQEKHAADAGTTRRFLDEAHITAQLQHPAIPPVYDLGNLPDGRAFLAMKLIKGETLDAMLRGRTDPSAERGRFVAIFEQICQAVAYAHAHDVIHRDLKPGNVMVGEYGEVQVMDWGLAKVLSARPGDEGFDPEATTGTAIHSLRDSDDAETQAGTILGTLAFMPPEQALGAIAKVDRRSDVFGLGAILAVVLTGQPPFPTGSRESLRLQAAQGKLDECFARLDGCGAEPDLVALCKRCLHPEPASRPANADEVAKAVAGLRQAADERARLAELDRVRAQEQRKRRRVQVGLVGAVLVVLALIGFGAGLFSLWRDAAVSRDEAIRLKGIAEKAQASEVEARKKLEVAEYGRTMQVAHQDWRDGNVTATLALLASTRPGLRGWEWRYVHRLCHSDLLTLEGHSGIMTSVAYSPDGKRILTGSWDMTAKVWDAQNGRELLSFKGHRNLVTSVAFSPDGKRVLTGSYDSTAKVWDAEKGQEVLSLEGHTSAVSSVAWSPDGKRILTGSMERTAKVWDAQKGQVVHTLEGHTNIVWSVAWSPDGKRILTGSHDSTAKVWDAEKGQEVLTLKGHMESVWSVSFSPDGKRILTGSGDKTAKVWDAEQGQEVLSLKGHTNHVKSVAYSPDGKQLLTGSEEGTAKVWDAQTGTEILTLKGHTSDVSSVAYSSDGKRILTGSGDNAKVWDAHKGQEVLTLKGYTDMVTSVAYSPDGKHILAGSSDNTAKVLDAEKGTEVLSLKGHTSLVTSVAYSPDGKRILTGSHDSTAKVWDAQSGTEVFPLKGHTNWVSSVTFSPDGQRILTGSEDRTARVWDALKGQVILSLEGHKFGVSSVAYSPDGKRILTGCGDNTAKVWDARSGTQLLGRSEVRLAWENASSQNWFGYFPL